MEMELFLHTKQNISVDTFYLYLMFLILGNVGEVKEMNKMLLLNKTLVQFSFSDNFLIRKGIFYFFDQEMM